MFTKNYNFQFQYRVMGFFPTAFNLVSASGNSYTDITEIITSSLKTILGTWEGDSLDSYYSNSAYGRVKFGTGTSAPTVDDYTLSGEQITTLNVTNSIVSNEDENGSTLTATYTITNTSNSEIRIGEVALFISYKNKGASGYRYCMIERTVLDNPVTIPAGGVGQVTYTISMPHLIT